MRISIKNSLWALALGILSGCAFDADLPDNVAIGCTELSDCPEGFTCRQDVGKCVPLENNDLASPEVLGDITVSPAHPGSVGTAFTLKFQASEPLPENNNLGEDNPQVNMNCGAADIPWEKSGTEESASETEGATYTFSYVAQGPPHEIPYQPCTLEIIMEDRMFNGGLATAPPVSFDFEAPRLLNTPLLLSQDRLKSGDDTQLRLTFDEDVVSGTLEVVLQNVDGEEVNGEFGFVTEGVPDASDDESTTNFTTYDATLTYDLEALDWSAGNNATYPIQIRAQDLAGNLLTQNMVQALRLDNEAPALQTLTTPLNVGIASNNELNGEMRSVQSLRIEIEMTELIQSNMETNEPRLRASCSEGLCEGQEPASLNLLMADDTLGVTMLIYELDYQSQQMADGIYDFALEGVLDQAGNPAADIINEIELGNVKLDNVPPVFESLSLESNNSFVSFEDVNISFCLTEKAMGGLAVTLLSEPQSAALVCGSAASNICNAHYYSCTFPPGVSVTDSRNFIPVTFQATDAAGNVGFANGQVQMDLSPPEILSADFSLGTYRSGQSAVLTLTFNEALRAEPSLGLDFDLVKTVNGVTTALNWNEHFVLDATNNPVFVLTSAAPFVPGDDGRYDITISNATDVLGLSSTVSESRGFWVDSLPPHIFETELQMAVFRPDFDTPACLTQAANGGALLTAKHEDVLLVAVATNEQMSDERIALNLGNLQLERIETASLDSDDPDGLPAPIWRDCLASLIGDGGGNIEAGDPAEPSEPTEPSESTEPSEFTEPSEPVEPSEADHGATAVDAGTTVPQANLYWSVFALPLNQSLLREGIATLLTQVTDGVGNIATNSDLKVRLDFSAPTIVSAQTPKLVYNINETPTYELQFSEPIFGINRVDLPEVWGTFQSLGSCEGLPSDCSPIKDFVFYGTCVSSGDQGCLRVAFDMDPALESGVMDRRDTIWSLVHLETDVRDKAGNEMTTFHNFDADPFTPFNWDQDVPWVDSNSLRLRYSAAELANSDTDVNRFSAQAGFNEGHLRVDFHHMDLDVYEVGIIVRKEETYASYSVLDAAQADESNGYLSSHLDVQFCFNMESCDHLMEGKEIASYTDGASVDGGSVIPPANWPWSHGIYVIEVEVTDMAGNVGSASKEISVDFRAPRVLASSSSLSPQFAKGGAGLNLQVTANEKLASDLAARPFVATAFSGDNGQEFDVDLFDIDCSTNGNCLSDDQRTVGFSAQVPQEETGNSRHGSYAAKVYWQDLVGNVSEPDLDPATWDWESDSFPFLIDRVPPEINLFFTRGQGGGDAGEELVKRIGDQPGYDTINFHLDWSDAIQADKLTPVLPESAQLLVGDVPFDLSTQDDSDDVHHCEKVTDETGAWTGLQCDRVQLVALMALEDGDYSITASIADLAGNIGTDRAQLEVDTTGPLIENLTLSPASAGLGTDIAINISLNEPAASWPQLCAKKWLSGNSASCTSSELSVGRSERTDFFTQGDGPDVSGTYQWLHTGGNETETEDKSGTYYLTLTLVDELNNTQIYLSNKDGKFLNLRYIEPEMNHFKVMADRYSFKYPHNKMTFCWGAQEEAQRDADPYAMEWMQKIGEFFEGSGVDGAIPISRLPQVLLGTRILLEKPWLDKGSYQCAVRLPSGELKGWRFEDNDFVGMGHADGVQHLPAENEAQAKRWLEDAHDDRLACLDDQDIREQALAIACTAWIIGESPYIEYMQPLGGSQILRVGMTDEVGNSVSEQTTVTLDFQAPVIDESNSFFTPTVAKAGDEIVMNVAFNEEVIPESLRAVVIVPGGDDDTNFFAESAEGVQWAHLVDENDHNGTYRVRFDAEDLVGNRTEALEFHRVFNIDTAAPEITIINAAELGENTYSSNGDHTNFTADICISDVEVNWMDLVMSFTPSSCSSSGPPSDTSDPCGTFLQCTWSAVTVESALGSHVTSAALSISYTDVAGNTGGVTQVLDVDFSGPYLVSTPVYTPNPATPGDEIYVFPSFSEAVKLNTYAHYDDALKIRVTVPATEFTEAYDVYDFFEDVNSTGDFRHIVGEWDIDGVYQVAFKFEDLAGNPELYSDATGWSSAGTFVIDKTPPALEIQDKDHLQDDLVYSLEGLHQSVVFSLCVGENVTADQLDYSIAGSVQGGCYIIELDSDVGDTDDGYGSGDDTGGGYGSGSGYGDGDNDEADPGSGDGFGGDSNCVTRFECLYAPTAMDPDVLAVVVSMTDEAGNVGQDSMALRFDMEPPRVVSVSNTLISYGRETEDHLPLLSPTAINEGGKVRFDFAFDERVRTRFNDEVAMRPQGHVYEPTCNNEFGMWDSTFSDGQSLSATLQFHLIAPCASPTAVAGSLSAFDGCSPSDLQEVGSTCEDICDPTPLPAGEYVPTIKVWDEAGNSFELNPHDGSSGNLVGQFEYDPTAPDVSLVNVDDLKHVRMPWGAEENGYVPEQKVISQAANAQGNFNYIESSTLFGNATNMIDETARIEFFADAAGETLVGYLDQNNGSSFTVEPLIVAESRELWLGLVDTAGNRSANRSRVDNVEWVATLYGKEQGSTYENPHQFREITSFQAHGEQGAGSDVVGTVDVVGDVCSLPSTEQCVGGVAGGDFLVSSVSPQESWTKKSRDLTDPPKCLDAKMVYDSLRGVVVLFCGDNARIYEYANGVWAYVPPLDPENDGSPGPRKGFAMVYYPPGGYTILDGGLFSSSNGGTADFGDVSEWDDLVRNDADVHDNNSVYANDGLVNNNTKDDKEIKINANPSQWIWDGVSWQRNRLLKERAYLGIFEKRRYGHEMVFDGSSQTVLMVGGCFDGTGATIDSCGQWATLGESVCSDLFSGPSNPSAQPSQQRFLYRFDGKSWGNELGETVPIAHPSACNSGLMFPQMAYHRPVRSEAGPVVPGHVVLWGGMTKGNANPDGSTEMNPQHALFVMDQFGEWNYHNDFIWAAGDMLYYEPNLESMAVIRPELTTDKLLGTFNTAYTELLPSSSPWLPPVFKTNFTLQAASQAGWTRTVYSPEDRATLFMVPIYGADEEAAPDGTIDGSSSAVGSGRTYIDNEMWLSGNQEFWRLAGKRANERRGPSPGFGSDLASQTDFNTSFSAVAMTGGLAFTSIEPGDDCSGGNEIIFEDGGDLYCATASDEFWVQTKVVADSETMPTTCTGEGAQKAWCNQQGWRAYSYPTHPWIAPDGSVVDELPFLVGAQVVWAAQNGSTSGSNSGDGWMILGGCTEYQKVNITMEGETLQASKACEMTEEGPYCYKCVSPNPHVYMLDSGCLASGGTSCVQTISANAPLEVTNNVFHSMVSVPGAEGEPDQIYVFGGINDKGDLGGQITGEMRVFVRSGTTAENMGWTTRTCADTSNCLVGGQAATWPIARIGASFIYHKPANSILMVGGWRKCDVAQLCGLGDEVKLFNDVWRYDLTNREWGRYCEDCAMFTSEDGIAEGTLTERLYSWRNQISGIHGRHKVDWMFKESSDELDSGSGGCINNMNDEFACGQWELGTDVSNLTNGALLDGSDTYYPFWNAENRSLNILTENFIWELENSRRQTPGGMFVTDLRATDSRLINTTRFDESLINAKSIEVTAYASGYVRDQNFPGASLKIWDGLNWKVLVENNASSFPGNEVMPKKLVATLDRFGEDLTRYQANGVIRVALTPVVPEEDTLINWSSEVVVDYIEVRVNYDLSEAGLASGANGQSGGGLSNTPFSCGEDASDGSDGTDAGP